MQNSGRDMVMENQEMVMEKSWILFMKVFGNPVVTLFEEDLQGSS